MRVDCRTRCSPRGRSPCATAQPVPVQRCRRRSASLAHGRTSAMSDHARIAPSAMKRTILCPGSVDLAASAGHTETVYAAQGTAAHKLLEMAMLLGIEPHAWLGEQIRGFNVDDDMADAVAHAIDYVRSYTARHPNAKVYLERRVHPGNMIGRKDCWGTLDISLHDMPRELVIVDYK